jgi:hypothetical protein
VRSQTGVWERATSERAKRRRRGLSALISHFIFALISSKLFRGPNPRPVARPRCAAVRRRPEGRLPSASRVAPEARLHLCKTTPMPDMRDRMDRFNGPPAPTARTLPRLPRPRRASQRKMSRRRIPWRNGASHVNCLIALHLRMRQTLRHLAHWRTLSTPTSADRRPHPARRPKATFLSFPNSSLGTHSAKPRFRVRPSWLLPAARSCRNFASPIPCARVDRHAARHGGGQENRLARRREKDVDAVPLAAFAVPCHVSSAGNGPRINPYFFIFL